MFKLYFVIATKIIKTGRFTLYSHNYVFKLKYHYNSEMAGTSNKPEQLMNELIDDCIPTYSPCD